MMQSMYSAKLGIQAQQQRVDTIANNIANISTHGFKSKRVDFKDALYTEMQNPASPQSNLNLMQGNGVLVSAMSRDYTQGCSEQTGEPLDMFIDGDGFFALDGNGDTLQYTRNGCFKVSNETDGQYLVTARGYYVMDTQLNKIKLPENIQDLSVRESGELSIGDNPSFATLNIVAFSNKDGLSSVGDNCYIETVASGGMEKSEASIKQGYLEASNVDLSLEMTRLIRAQRAFSLAGKAIIVSDEMESTTNNIRR